MCCRGGFGTNRGSNLQRWNGRFSSAFHGAARDGTWRTADSDSCLLGIVSAPEKVDLPWILKVSSGFVTWSARSTFTTTVVVVVLVVAVFSMMAAGVGSVHEFVSNPSCKGPLRISGWPWAVMNQGSGQTTVAVWSPLGSEHAACVVACGSPTDALNWAAGGVACCSRVPDTAGASPTIPLPPVAVRGDPAPGVRKMMEVL